jgi:hypothetical protein
MPNIRILDEEYMVYDVRLVPKEDEPHHTHVKVTKRFYDKYLRIKAAHDAMQHELGELYRG